ncbi:MAG: hypothetical protein JXA33_10555 [Anaerolineae bacterium]|nr:hypothetical protein [Anaerolineae bacterium]
MKAWQKLDVRRVVRVVVSLLVAVMMVMPNVAGTQAAQPQMDIYTPMLQSNDQCESHEYSCFSTDNIKVSEAEAHYSSNEWWLSIDFSPPLGNDSILYAIDEAGEVYTMTLSSGSSGGSISRFSFEEGNVIDFYIVNQNDPNERFPNIPEADPENQVYRVWLKGLSTPGGQPLDVGQGTYYWNGHSADDAFKSFLVAYERNLFDGRDLGPVKWKTGNPSAAVHEWNGYLVQDFVGDGGNTVYHGVMIYNHDRCTAFSVVNGILDAFLDIAQNDNAWIGAPVSDEQIAPSYYEGFEYKWIGYFEKGFISTSNDVDYRGHTYYPEISEITITVNDDATIGANFDISPAPGYPEEDGPVDATFHAFYFRNAAFVEKHIQATDIGFSDGKRHYSVELDTPIDLGTRLSFVIDAIRTGDGRVSHYPADWYENEVWIDDIQPGEYGPLGEEGWSHPLDGDFGSCDSGDPGTRPPSLHVADENWNIVHNWEYLAQDTIRLIAFFYDQQPDTLIGSLTSEMTGANIPLTFERVYGSLYEYRVSIDADEITTQEENKEIAFVGSDLTGLVDFVYGNGYDGATIPKYYTLKSLAGGTGDRFSTPRIPPGDLTFLKAGGFEDLTASLEGLTAKVFVQNQADILVHLGHGAHPRTQPPSGHTATGGVIQDSINDGTLPAYSGNIYDGATIKTMFGNGQAEWRGFQPQVANTDPTYIPQYSSGSWANDIGNAWIEDVDFVLLFDCSVLDVNDYNGNFDDDWPPDKDSEAEKGPFDAVMPDGTTPWHPGERWAKIPGPDYWLGFNAGAPLFTGQNGAKIIASWLEKNKGCYAGDCQEYWREATREYFRNANNASAISVQSGNYYYWEGKCGQKCKDILGKEVCLPAGCFPDDLSFDWGWIEQSYDRWQPGISGLNTDYSFASLESPLDPLSYQPIPMSPPIEVYLLGPAKLHVYDRLGNHVGVNKSGDIDIQIPGGDFNQPTSEATLITIEGGDISEEYSIEILGEESGTASLRYSVPDHFRGHMHEVAYVDFTVDDQSHHLIQLSYGMPLGMSFDVNGDDVLESRILPEYVLFPRLASSPSLRTCKVEGSNGWFVSEAEFNLSNRNPTAVAQYWQGGQWINDVTTVSLSEQGRTDFAIRSVYDGVVSSFSISMAAHIDTVAPVSSYAISASLPLQNDTYITDVTLVLTGTDPGIGASGVAYIGCRLNGGQWNPCESILIEQNGENVVEYRAVDIAGNVEATQRITLTLDKTVHTIISLDATQANRLVATRVLMAALWNGQIPLMATEAFSIAEEYGKSAVIASYPAGTFILPGEVAGDFTKQVHIGPLDVPVAQVLYPQIPVIFNSISADERASWEQLEIGVVLEDTLNCPDWPRVDEVTLVSDTIPSDVIFIPAGVTADVQTIFAESGAAPALLAQVQAGKWVVCQGDGCLLAQQAGLVPDGTLSADDTLPAGVSALTAVEQEAILSYNWPDGMELARYNDTPRFTLSEDLIRVADYADNGEAAIVLRRVGAGGVILIGGHASANTSTYGLLYHALFTAGAEQVGSQVSVEQQFMPGVEPDVVPGLEPEMPVLVRTTQTNYGTEPVSNFYYTEFIAPGFHLLTPPTVTLGTVMTRTITETQGTGILPAGTLVIWTADTLPSGAHELSFIVANVATDILKPGEVTVSTADFSYTANNATARTVQLSRPDAVVRALLPALIAHNFTDEPDNVYPLSSEGFYIHVRHDLENKLETRANNLVYTVTVPFFDIIRDAYDQTTFPYIQGTQTNVWVMNEIYGYPERDYPIPMDAADKYWYYTFEDWDCGTWVRIPNPQHTPITIPPEIQSFVYQTPNNGDLWVAGKTLVFDLGTMLSYDAKDPFIRYKVFSREVYGWSVSFSADPVDGTLVLEGNGGSVYTAIGQDPIPFREYFPEAAINNPIAPVTSEIGYTDLWGRNHTVTESVRSSFYDIIPYPRTGDAVSTRAVDVYGIEGERGDRLYDVAAAQTLTVTYVIKAASVNRTLSQEQFFIQKFLPRGLGYDIEFLSWESSNGSFVLLDEYSLQYPAFELLSFQGVLPENTPQVLTITARLRTYPEHVREGSFLVDGGVRFAAPVELGGPGQYDTGMTHVRVEQGYAANPEVIKRVAEAQVPRQGGLAHEIIHLNSAADVQRYWEETYVDSVGTLDKAATARVGGSWGPDLYFATVAPGGETLLVYEVVNAEGQDWSNVALEYVAPPGITLTPIFTDGVEAPPNVYDTPYLWATEIPDIGRGVYYYRVHVDESVAPGVMYPILFTLTGDNVPDAAEFPLPVARVGVGGDVNRILGQTLADQVIDLSPDYVTPVAAALATSAQMATTVEYTATEQWSDFFAALTTPVPFTYTVLDNGARLITYTIPAEWQTLPQQNGTELTGEAFLLVQTAITATEPGYRVVNYGPELVGVDSFDFPLTVSGNPGYTTVSGPALTGTYTLLTVTSPFYGGMVIDPAPGEVVDVWVDIAIINVGNRPARSPVISTTVDLTGVEILDVIPAPVSVISGVITWQLEDSILPYGGLGDPELDTEHVRVQVRFTPPDVEQIRTRLARLETTPFYVPLLVQSGARYVYTWGEQTFTVNSPLGAAYSLHVGADPLPAPTLVRAAWDAARRRVLLEWTEIAGARDYVVYRSTQPDRDFYQVGPMTSGATMENIITDDPLAQVYYYVVRARSATLVEGRHSSVVAVFTGRMFRVYLPLVLRE